jgi:prolyl-tRNA synthetase
VAKTVQSYKDLPLRVYQISTFSSLAYLTSSWTHTCLPARKYRDEKRPRQGILRAREFTMKDLYSFDMTENAAMDAYEQVSLAYKRIFEELKLPVLVARASSGDMGGDMSHEYHLPSAAGDDTIISCRACKHTFNEEVPYTVHENNPHLTPKSKETQVWHGISRDRRTLVNVWYPKVGVNRKTKEKYELTHRDINVQAVKIVFPELDASVENPLALWEKEVSKSGDEQLRMVRILDSSINPDFANHIDHDGAKLETYPPWFRSALADDKIKISLLSMVDFPDWRALRPRDGDPCPACGEAAIEVHKAIELGHTFYLGKRYTEPFEATVSAPAELLPADATTPSSLPGTRKMTLHMGCYGIGVSRIIGAVAEHFANGRDLRWPRAIAPYDVIILSHPDIIPADAELVYDALVRATRPVQQQQQQQPMDVLLDDRHLRKFAWKLRDAFSLGFPVVVLLGKEWEQNRLLEVQAKGLRVRHAIGLEELPDLVQELLERL